MPIGPTRRPCRPQNMRYMLNPFAVLQCLFSVFVAVFVQRVKSWKNERVRRCLGDCLFINDMHVRKTNPHRISLLLLLLFAFVCFVDSHLAARPSLLASHSPHSQRTPTQHHGLGMTASTVRCTLYAVRCTRNINQAVEIWIVWSCGFM